jgi:hypothetical protein
MPSSQANLYVERTELTLHDGSVLTFPFADNNIPYMLTDWQPIVGITFQDQPIMTDKKSIGMCVAQETNHNLSTAQKDLLTWHWKLGHCHFSWVQRLASAPRSEKRRRVMELTSRHTTVLRRLLVVSHFHIYHLFVLSHTTVIIL